MSSERIFHLSLYHLKKYKIYIFREALLSVKNSEIKQIIIDCSNDNLPSLFKQAQEIGIMTNNYEYIVTSMLSILNKQNKKLFP